MTGRQGGRGGLSSDAARVRHPVTVSVGVGLLAVALLGGVAWIASDQASQAVKSQAHEGVRSNRDAAVRALVRQTDVLKRTTAAFGANSQVIDSLRRPTPVSLRAVSGALSTLARSEGAPAAFVCDLRGRIVAIVPTQAALIGQDFSFRDWFRGVSRTGRPYVSAGYRSAATGHPIVVGVAAPVSDASRRVGYVTVLWQLDSVRALSRDARADNGVTIAVSDQTGQQLTGNVSVDERGQPLDVPVSALTRKALAGQSVSSVSGGNILAASPVPGLGWTVTAALPTSVGFAPERDFRRSLGATLGAAILLVLLATVVAARFSRRRARELTIFDEERLHLKALFAASPIGIMEGYLDGTILAVNDSMVQMLGFSVDEFLTRNAREFTHPDSAAELVEDLHAVADGSLSGYTRERLYRARDGSAVPVMVSVVVLPESGAQQRRMVGFIVDQREQRAAAAALQALSNTLAEHEAFLAAVLDTIRVSVLACDSEGALTLVNREAQTILGLGEDTEPTSILAHLKHVDGQPMDLTETPLLRALVEGEVNDAELLVVTDDGRAPRQMLGQARRLVGPNGAARGAVAGIIDVTAIRAAEAAWRDSEERFRRVFDEGLTGKLLASSDGRILRANTTLSTLLGRESYQLIGLPVIGLFDDPADQGRIQELVRAGEGDLRVEMALSKLYAPSRWGLVVLSWLTEHDGGRILLVQVEDITARRDAEKKLTELAMHDELTGLPNRRLLMERCERAFAAAQSGRAGSSSVAVLFIDLDGFKPINDRAGHATGDQLLAAVGHDLQAAVRPTDTVARVGGDEFIVLLEQGANLQYLRDVADRVTEIIRRQVVVDETTLTLSASVGIAHVDLAHEPDMSPEQLLRRADAAMYRAKERGRDRYDFFDVDLQELNEARYVLAQAMRDGLRDDRISVVFQPVVDVDSGTVVGAEALMRLSDEDGHPMPTLPAVVAAEAAGLAEALGDRVLQLSLDAAGTWPEHMSLAVNISARELTGRNLRGRVEQALQRHGFDPTRLVLEITESSILNAGPSALAALEQLRQGGIRVAIDDFGTAYATLQNLTMLPVDVLKVDVSFTAGLPGQRTHTAIVHGVASMAHELGIPCIVEGVETDLQLAALRGMSVQAQGWFYGPPQGPEAVPCASG